MAPTGPTNWGSPKIEPVTPGKSPSLVVATTLVASLKNRLYWIWLKSAWPWMLTPILVAPSKMLFIASHVTAAKSLGEVLC